VRVALYSKPQSSEHRLGIGLPNGRIMDAMDAAEVLGAGKDQIGLLRSLKICLQAGETGTGLLRRVDAWARENPQKADALSMDETQVQFHAPVVDPGKFLCVGKNSKHHLEELVRTNLIKEIPQEPTGFIKVASCLAGHGAKVKRPDDIRQLDYEVEMGFVISKGGMGVSKADALDHVFGITVHNDLTSREIQRREVISGTRFWTAKNSPGFGPVGPYVVTLDEIADLHDLYLTCHVNGELRNRFCTGELIYDIPAIIEHHSRYVPLEPGDLFSTGAAGGVAAAQENAEALYLKPGDVVDAGIEGVMTLRNHIV